MFSDLSAQSFGKLTGTVKNKNTNEAIIGATIFLKTEPGIGTSSDINGNLNLYLEEGNYIIVAKSL
jgi:hypothetical protein